MIIFVIFMDDYSLTLDKDGHLTITGTDAELSYGSRKEMPDSEFGIVFEDERGNKIRKFPLHDCPHVRNALSRLPQSDLNPAQKKQVMAKIRARNKTLGCGIKIAGEEPPDKS